MEAPILVASNIRKSYGEQEVLTGVDLSVTTGSIAAVLGPNGAGKTTLVRILSTLSRPDSGTALIAGHDILREPESVRAVISLTGQYAALDELLTGEENLLLIARLWKLNRHEARSRARELLDAFDLSNAARRPVRTYSGGMKRKLDLAASLIGHPQVLFLDEPTTGLDPRSRNSLWEMVRNLKRSGVTIVLTTQYLEEADQLADDVIVVDHGRVVAEGDVDTLKRQIGSEIAILNFRDPALANRARTVVSGQPADGLSDCEVRVAIDGSASHVYDLMALLRSESLPVETITIQKPTLDDVFLTLTATTPTSMEVPA